MGKAMVDKYICKKWDEITRDSVICKAYNLGIAVAFHHTYNFYKLHISKSDANAFLKQAISTKEPYIEILKELIMLDDKEAVTKAEKIAEIMYECEKTHFNKQEETGQYNTDLILEIIKVLDKHKEHEDNE